MESLTKITTAQAQALTMKMMIMMAESTNSFGLVILMEMVHRITSTLMMMTSTP